MVVDEIQEIYRHLPRRPAADPTRTLFQGFEDILHMKIGWQGRPCLGDGLLAHTFRCAKEYIDGLDEATGIIDKETEVTHHYMAFMLWFAAGRTDLAANLLVDETDPSISAEDKKSFRLQWRNLGFPIEIREKLREVLGAA